MRSLAILLLVLAGAAHAADLPADVSAFVEERQQCDHFRGEEPYDEARRVEIDSALDRYCRGTDARLAKLKTKYRHDAAVCDALAAFEDKIE